MTLLVMALVFALADTAADGKPVLSHAAGLMGLSVALEEMLSSSYEYNQLFSQFCNRTVYPMIGLSVDDLLPAE